ncbi:hypothetical protein NIES2104_61370 [Leptolyngbya sp. NIES-2104]|nr:hypothetical protein NIES2104_61370 [Leptolyngbya sp. NIES-2104]
MSHEDLAEFQIFLMYRSRLALLHKKLIICEVSDTTGKTANSAIAVE